VFGFIPESVFTFIPESRSESSRNPVHLHPGTAFTFSGIRMMILAPFGFSDAGQQMYHFVGGFFDRPRFDRGRPECPYSSMIVSRGDRTGITVTGSHAVAENSRIARRLRQKSIPRALRLIERLRDQLGSMLDR
jgi:hypothetical protein